MIERFLTDVLGIPWDEVHEEAERIEHAMSPVLEERMRAAIGDATTCPHGHPIVEGAREQGSLLADVELGAKVHVLRFENEAEELLHYLKDAGLEPGLEGTVESSDEDGRDDRLRRRHATTSRAASPRPSRSAPTRRRRRGRRSPSSSSSPATATAAETAGYCGIATLTIGAQVGCTLPPRGSAVTITVLTPSMSSIVAVAVPSRVGDEERLGRDDLLVALHPGLQDLVARAAGAGWPGAGCPIRRRGPPRR